MNLLEHTAQWVNSEVLQGKTTIVLSVVLAVALFCFLNLKQSFSKGLIIPISLYLLVLLGYGLFQVTQRPAHIEKVSQGLQTHPNETITAELEKAQNDSKTYATVKVVWVVIIVGLGLLFFVLKNDFWKGLTLGFIIFFIGMLIFDGLLHHRLKPYLAALESFSK